MLSVPRGIILIKYWLAKIAKPASPVWDPQPLDFETLNSYTFSIQVRENLKNLRFPADNMNSAITAAQVNIAQEVCSPTLSTTSFH